MLADVRAKGHLEAVLVAAKIPYEQIQPMEKVECSEFDLAVVVGAFEEIDPDLERKQPTCRVWEATKVVYIQTQVESYSTHGLFDK